MLPFHPRETQIFRLHYQASSFQSSDIVDRDSRYQYCSPIPYSDLSLLVRWKLIRHLFTPFYKNHLRKLINHTAGPIGEIFALHTISDQTDLWFILSSIELKHAHFPINPPDCLLISLFSITISFLTVNLNFDHEILKYIWTKFIRSHM